MVQSNVPCTRCGMPELVHPDISRFLGQELDDKVINAIYNELLHTHELFGNVCMQYIPDNLKYLEQKYSNKGK